MDVVILQPSYVPWRGYFDQIRRADLFVFYDDAQYDKHGWRNRNQIKTLHGKQWITIPVLSKGVTEGRPINEVRIDWRRPWPRKHARALEQSYAKAPFFRTFEPWLDSVYARKSDLLADFTIDTTLELTEMLGIAGTKFVRSSEIPGISGHGTDRLVQLLERVGATHYISGPSARDYIERQAFEEAGISLEYMEYDYPEYPQLHGPFDPFVTILDLLFMVGGEALKYLDKASAAP